MAQDLYFYVYLTLDIIHFLVLITAICSTFSEVFLNNLTSAFCQHERKDILFFIKQTAFTTTLIKYNMI